MLQGKKYPGIALPVVDTVRNTFTWMNTVYVFTVFLDDHMCGNPPVAHLEQKKKIYVV
jgi:hypothetical protein